MWASLAGTLRGMLYLVRHGATVPNLHKPPILQGSGLDAELSPEGRAQADAVADVLASRPVAVVYTSPLIRARQTAAAIAAPHGLDLRTVETLHEIAVGEWEGRTWPQIMADDAARYAFWAGDPGEARYPGGESYADVAARVLPTLEQIAAAHAEEVAVVVAHRAVNRSVAGRLLGLDPRRWKDVPQDNTAINVLDWTGERLKLVTLNDVSHLHRS